MAITTHWAPNCRRSRPQLGPGERAELTDLVGAGSSTAWASSTERMPPPIVKGMKTLSAVRRASWTIVSLLVGGVMSRR